MSLEAVISDPDPFAARIATQASGLLRQFNAAGVLSAADVHVARRLGALAGESSEPVLLAAALAVRGPRLGHVHVDLAAIRGTAAIDTEDPIDLDQLPWPDPETWAETVAASPLVACEGAEGSAVRPLRLRGSWLYLDRYWAEEIAVADALLHRSGPSSPEPDPDLLAAGLERMFPGETGGRQADAARAAVRQRFAVVAGGPGTGKTTTVARIVALLAEQAQAAGRPLPLIALAAPTGKAAARLQEAVREETGQITVSGEVRELLLELSATTLHRLLGWRPGSNSRFRHDRRRRLAHDVVIVDETSMVSLSLMARLVEALRDDARLVLVGDPGQLASIEAGAVLGDIVGPAAEAPAPSTASGFGQGIVVLDRVHRFGGDIAALATAIRRGDADAVLERLRAGGDVSWIEADVAQEAALGPVRDGALACAHAVMDAARDGDAAGALDALGDFRILCAHRRGPHGVTSWNARMQSWLAEERGGLATAERWYVGRPLLVTENDYELGLNNGDTGVVLAHAGRVQAAFARGSATVTFSPSRLGSIETVYAMTIHKSQGSQFDAAAVLLPDPGSRILTRELLYTAATRARRRLIIAGTEEAVRAAVQRPVARASGLRARLWG
ncbi:MAG TPA: exodeoxyribonuclease V subunit alpha [Solirubrobacteraceae bacterium]|nr:exodeoxyribonuclease V subunit alpha [Solirubrobacteraceae bacterium]